MSFSGRRFGRANQQGTGGRRPDLGNRYFRSQWEANYARHLNFRIAHKDMDADPIVSWEYEVRTFTFPVSRGGMAYTPDFKVQFASGRHEWHEVKGWMDQRSRTVLRRMTKYYPGEVIRVIDKDWFRDARRWAALIPGWESSTKRLVRRTEPMEGRSAMTQL